jgi:hypothetical protein
MFATAFLCRVIKSIAIDRAPGLERLERWGGTYSRSTRCATRFAGSRAGSRSRAQIPTARR